MNWLETAIKNEIIRTASSVKDFVRQMSDMMKSHGREPPEGFAYTTHFDYFLENGKEYISSPLTPDELAVLKEAIKGHKLMYKPKQCFYNAQNLAQEKRECRYVEGYLFSGVIPLEHGWNSINGKVIDFTMAHANGGKPILGEIPAGWEYFGVELPTTMIRSLWARKGVSIPLVTNYEDGYPLLRKKPNEIEQETEDEGSG